MILNSQQENASKESIKWFTKQKKQVFEVSGPAGSGKTTIVNHMVQELGLDHSEVLFMAYVGKAAMALSLKGNNAKTIHGSIYEFKDKNVTDEYGNVQYNNGRPVTKKGFSKRDSIGGNIKLIVVDEGSMVNPQIGADILSYGIPVLVLGDLNQLPPIFGKPYFLNDPDIILTEIMRQSKDNPIIRLSQMALHGMDIPYGKYGNSCMVIPKEYVTDKMLTSSDIILCGKNITREAINYKVRTEILGIDKKFPVIGDKFICRKNNWQETLGCGVSLINGMIGYVEGVDVSTYKKGSINIDFRPEFLQDEMFTDIAIDPDYPFLSYTEKTNMKYNPYDRTNKFELGHAITIHLSQGSQYDNVLMYCEHMGNKEFRNKLWYTGITRAVDGLILAI